MNQPYIPELTPEKLFKVIVVVYNEQEEHFSEYLIEADDIDSARESLETRLEDSVERGWEFRIGQFIEQGRK